MVASFGKAIEDALVEATTHTDLKIRIHLYLTNTSQELGKINPLSNTPVEFHQGVRPDFRDVLGQVAGRSISLAIGVCGPTALVDHVQAAAREIETSGLTKIAIHRFVFFFFFGLFNLIFFFFHTSKMLFVSKNADVIH